jgi:hypothetical protein
MINGVVMAWSSGVSAGVRRKAAVTPPCAGQTVVFSNGPKGALLVYFESDARTQQRAHA